MSKEVRSIYLVVLTLLVYAGSIYFDKGTILFPFPLNEALFLAVSLQFIYWNKKLKFISLIILGTSLFGFLGNQIYWSMLLSNESMLQFSEALWMDVFKLLFGLGIITWAIYTSTKQKNKLNHLLTTFFLGAFITGFILESNLLILISYSIQFLSIIYKPAIRPYDYLWVLLFILEGSAWISFALN